MRPCAARGCQATLTESVRTKQGTIDACAEHRKALEDAGDVVPFAAPGLIVVDSAEHRAKIRAGIDAAREAGVHVGRPKVPVPGAAVEAVRAGEAVKTVARRFGVEPNTLRRRVAGEDDEPSEVAPASSIGVALREASKLLTDAAKLHAKGEASIRAGEEMIAAARDAMRRAHAILGEP